MVYFLWLVIFGKSGPGFIAAELAMLVLLMTIHIKKRNRKTFAIEHRKSKALDSANLLSRTLLIVCAGLVASSLFFSAWNREGTRSAMSIMTLMTAGYFLIYIITPYELKWHLAASLSCLLMLIWPSMILLVFIVSEVPENCFSFLPGRHPLRPDSRPER